MKKFLLAISVITTIFSSPAIGQEWIIGAGASEFSRPGAKNGGLLSIEYAHTPFFEKNRFSARFAGALEVQETGDVFGGVGISGNWDLKRNWFIQASVMPGVYAESVDLNDLGSTFEIRSLLAVGKRFQNGQAVSLAIAHKSNASTAAINPGVNSLLLRWHIPILR